MRNWFNIIILLLIAGHATNIGAVELDSLAWRLAYQVWSYPQEKVYVATDRDIYAAGDTIRFRAFLVDATLLKQKRDGSGYVYVELTDPFGETVRRIKVKRNDGIFAGYIPLPEEMAEGYYTLGSYTLFMKNQGEDYIFRKGVPIKSRMAQKYDLKTQIEGNNLVTSLNKRFNGAEVRTNNISLHSPDEVIREDIHHRSSMDFKISDKVRKKGVVKVKYDRYEKFVRLPVDTSSFSVTFHPEGGYLVPDAENLIGFKAIGNDGLGLDITGVVKDTHGNVAAKFTSTHSGMGSFTFVPKSDEIYDAIVNGRSFKLPEVEKSATVINVRNAGRDSVTLMVSGRRGSSLILLANNSGIPQYVSFFNEDTLRVSRKNLGQGLVQLLLLDSDGKILSSRMIFNRDGYIYADTLRALPEGDYAVSIRSNGTSNGVSSSIVSELMLQGELKGHIERPDYYFEAEDETRDRDLDNLLLTQGWERYDLPEVFAGRFAEPHEPMEIGGSLSGTVRSRWTAKPLKDAVVNVIAPSLGYVGVETTDSVGRFIVEGLDWPEGTAFALRAFNKNGNPEHNLEIDADDKMPVMALSDEYTGNGETDDYKFSNGATWLDELEVTAAKSDEEQRLDMLRSLGVKMMSGEEIEANNITSYDEVFRKIPGLRIENGNLVHVGSKASLNNRHAGMVELWVDGVQWQSSATTSVVPLVGQFDSKLMGGMPKALPTYSQEITNTFNEFSEVYPIHMIDNIQYYRPSIALIISQAAALGAGALVMTTKDGSKVKDWDKGLFVKSLEPLGYQKAAESYKPHFTYDPIGTEYVKSSAWYPTVRNIDKLSDIDDASMVIEGISDNGAPVYIY